VVAWGSCVGLAMEGGEKGVAEVPCSAKAEVSDGGTMEMGKRRRR